MIQPALAGRPGLSQSSPGRIAVDSGHNRSREGQTALVDLLMRFHCDLMIRITCNSSVVGFCCSTAYFDPSAFGCQTAPRGLSGDAGSH
ncbi:MAG: hypothetical protein KA118_15920, partial [Verrucomicrobia bacterium]|nr:hypothetical protein [Verrucomicrobiota bacterium]